MTTLRGIRSDRLRALALDAIAQGFRIVQTGNGHPVLVSPSGERVWFSTTANDGYHIAANVRASLMRAGYVPRDRRPRPILAPPLPIVRPSDDEPSSEVPAMQAQPSPDGVGGAKRDTRGGYTFVSKGKAIAADDVRIGGQPFRFRTNADGSLDVTTLRRKHQRTWSSKSGDAVKVRQTIADWVATVEPWESSDMPVNGHADPSVPELAEPAPILPAAVLAELPAVVADRVPERLTDAYPIARGLDELDRTVGPAILALEAAGKADAANLVRSELTMTPAEAELLKLYRASRRD